MTTLNWKKFDPSIIPEAPVFHPTVEEFKSPIQYIQSIAAEAEKYGICRVVPPDHFQFPFALDKEKVAFPTRVQKLNSLECRSREERFFMDRLRLFQVRQPLYI